MAEADVAVMIYSLQGGGAERMTLNLVDGFLKRGLKVDLVLCRVEGPYLASVPDDVRIINCNARTSLEWRGAVERYLAESPPKALLAMMEGAGVVALWARARVRGTCRVAVSARNVFSRLIPSGSTREQRQAGVRLISEMMTRSGLTSVHQTGGGTNDLIAYQDAYHAGELRTPVEV